MAHDVFISYSSRDKTIADAVCAALEARKIRCWIAPRDVLPGIPFPEALIDALNRSRIVVLVFSAGSNSSPQVMREVERAVNKGLPIIPFRIEDVPLSKAMEYFLSAPHWLDALTPPLEAHLQKLADTVQMLLAAGGEGGSPVAALEMEASEVSEPRGGARPLGWSRWAALLAVLAVLGGAAGTGLWLSGRLPARPAPTGAGLAPPALGCCLDRQKSVPQGFVVEFTFLVKPSDCTHLGGVLIPRVGERYNYDFDPWRVKGPLLKIANELLTGDPEGSKRTGIWTLQHPDIRFRPPKQAAKAPSGGTRLPNRGFFIKFLAPVWRPMLA